MYELITKLYIEMQTGFTNVRNEHKVDKLAVTVESHDVKIEVIRGAK